MRQEESRNKCRGEITIFLCLIFLVMISLVGVLMESVSVRLARNERRVLLELALESSFAEYDKELLDTYEIFAIDGTYNTGQFKKKLFLGRLDYYGATGTKNELQRVELLSDNHGMPFYRGAVQYIRNIYGLQENASEDEVAWMELNSEGEAYLEEAGVAQEEMEASLEAAEESIPEEGNPIVAIEEVKKKGLLKSVLPKDMEISNLSIETSSLASGRALKKGNYPQTDDADLISDAMFRQYLSQHFENALSKEEGKTLAYELEYLLAGKDKDAKNLEAVLRRILLLRFVPNYACLQTDSARKGEVKSLAATLCSSLQVAAITPVVEQLLLFAWAYGESIAELQIMMDGGTVAAVKTKEDWLLPLANLATVGAFRYTKKDEKKNGMSYEEYLQVLLLLTTRGNLCMRGLDLIESRTGLRADACICRVQVLGTCSLRRGLVYEFHTQYAYR